ncbi:MAG: chemotaxis-specific protein-glutamate methyltransferase CheB [Pseudomonadota bacterium]
MSASTPIRVLIVDDSAAGRAAIAEVLDAAGDIQVVGRAMDGAEALQLVQRLQPDLLTLDLEMPRMDGFSFLRIMRAQRPRPVIVVSSDTRPEASIQALELGAFDFVVKPGRLTGQNLVAMGEQLVLTIRAALGKRAPAPVQFERRPPGSATLNAIRVPPERVRLIAIGASTGGPMAIQSILSELAEPLDCPVIIAQHMPAQFTYAFADRLDRTLTHRVHEARDGDVLEPGQVLIAPGGQRTTVGFDAEGTLVARVSAMPERDPYTPSVDRLFETAAACCRAELVAVVLTGMGADGAMGVRAVDELGGLVITESPETALIDGMPEEARRACPSARSLRLDQIARVLSKLGRLRQTEA